MNLLKRLFVEEEGQGLVEYALILGLIAVIAIVALTDIGTNVKARLEEIKTALTKKTA
ncbi:pilus assembly protein Flp/PilA [Alkalibaculum bacchi]|uniref:Pilus assembly protein Flp/PilA n=1 Tax=Alkalibaculum bacchi TaxID=645887 RepID=A0A366IBY6_9FIRM|nr:Flp family type IVb pilin [Alkalibaculum bacchi]RBP66002.1 pilus assembly protein Flp/PilA [Alkalibaculum bacchi]